MSLWKQEPIAQVREFQQKFPQVASKLIETLEEVLVTSRLDKKTQELVIIGLLAMRGFESGFKFHLR